MTTHGKEVVFHADLVQLEHLGPDLRQLRFGLVARRHILRLAAHLWRRQRLAVDLAARGHRQALEEYIMRWHHVVRQTFLQMRAQYLLVRLAHHVGHQLLLAVDFTGQHDRRTHLRQRFQRRLDFAQLDPETTDLDLAVDAAQVFNAAIVQEAAQIARLIQSRARLAAERVRQEFIGRQLRAVQVTARQTDPADIDLSHHANRHRPQRRIEQVQLHVCQRPSDQRALWRWIVLRRCVACIGYVP